MTSHGFGRPTVRSSRISEEDITKIARQISEIKPIVRSHVVQHVVRDKTVGYDIIFEFDHLRKHDPPMTCMDLLKELKKIRVGEHQITDATDFWIVQSTY